LISSNHSTQTKDTGLILLEKHEGKRAVFNKHDTPKDIIIKVLYNKKDPYG